MLTGILRFISWPKSVLSDVEQSDPLTVLVALGLRCEPFTGYDVINKTGTILSAIIRGCAVINDTSVPIYVDIIDNDKKPVEPDSGAVMYIIAVLVFYSAGIVTMIVKYLKREKRELEEEKALEDFFRTMPAYKKEREMNNVNRVAIHAFHALTSFSYDDDDISISGDEDESDLRGCVDTIKEVDHGENDTVSNNVVFDLDGNIIQEENISSDPMSKFNGTEEIV